MRFFIFLFYLLTLPAFAQESTCDLNSNVLEQLNRGIWSANVNLNSSCHNNTLVLTAPSTTAAISYTLIIPFNLFTETYPFYGLAHYYNGSNVVKIDADGTVTYLETPVDQSKLEKGTWLGWKSRFNVLMVTAPNANSTLTGNRLVLNWPANTPINLEIYLGPSEPEFTALQYSYLWQWLAVLCRGIETLLVMLHDFLGINWGIVILVFGIVLKLLLLPLHLWVSKLQNTVNRHQAILEPKLKQIKAKYDGEEAHQRIMAEYKALGISPFHTLKPLIGAFIQIPILIAVFNVLGEMPELVNASFLWIESLAYPDSIYSFNFTLPLMGNQLSALPCLMTAITIISTLLFQSSGSVHSVKWQKIRLYLMALAFFILFYPFPAAMVLFWTLMNLLQLIQQQVCKS